jgi:hypothetical protein
MHALGWGGTVRERAVYYRHPNQPRFSKGRVKKNGGREGFPRLAAVCWAGGQLENAQQKLVAGRREIQYDRIISPDSPRKQACESFLPADSEWRVHNLTELELKIDPA